MGDSIFPKPCDCCDPPKILNNKQSQYYHNKIKNKMAPKANSKRNRSEVKKPDEYLDSKMDILTKAVERDYYDPELPTLKSTIGLIEDDIEDDIKEGIRSVCLERLDKLENAAASIREASRNNYNASSEEEKAFWRSLSKKRPGLAERVDSNGTVYAGIPSEWQRSDEDLLFLLADMKARVQAVEYEIRRRSDLAEKMVYEFLVERFKRKREQGYTQEYTF